MCDPRLQPVPPAHLLLLLPVAATPTCSEPLVAVLLLCEELAQQHSGQWLPLLKEKSKEGECWAWAWQSRGQVLVTP